jgi:hypothetical protein
MPESDVERLKEFVFRSTEQLSHLTTKTNTMDGKIDVLMRDVLKVKLDIENHPLLCPINTERIKEIVDRELSKLPDKKLNRNVKLASITVALFAFLTFVLTLFNIFHKG